MHVPLSDTESEKSYMFQDFFEAVWPARCRSDQDTERVGKRYGIRDMETYWVLFPIVRN